MPWLGGVVALVALGGAIRRKGVLGGTVDTALDMIPFVGGAKNLAELGRGRDFIRDKRIVAVGASGEKAPPGGSTTCSPRKSPRR